MKALTKHTPVARYNQLRAHVASLSKRGATPEQIAGALGVSVFAVRTALLGPRPKSHVEKPVVIVEPCEVPRWVPASLVGTYQDLAAKRGEEHAASVVRRLKAEARS